MKFPDLAHAKENIVHALAAQKGLPPEHIKVVTSPYRICPLGAHIDHQGGQVLGMTIDAYTLLAFVPGDQPRISLTSCVYAGEISFGFDAVPEVMTNPWGGYVRAAVLALQKDYPLNHGLTGIVDGMLPGCGLSSSASVLLAYLFALASANHLSLQPWDYVRLTLRAEREFMGLNNGILDQASIVFGRKDALVHIDPKKEEVALLPAPPEWSEYTILIAYSGYSRELTTSGFNGRVQECRQAAQALAELAGLPFPQNLSDIPEAVFHQFNSLLPPRLSRRASHYFGEVERVHLGKKAWENGEIDTLGQLMVETCKSSVELYECGIPALCDLQRIVLSTEGMAGSRFMGGGFGGCVVGFVKKDSAAAAAEKILKAYRKLHAEAADRAAVYLTQSADGIRFI
jgi:galactokinase/galacturonokinase